MIIRVSASSQISTTFVGKIELHLAHYKAGTESWKVILSSIIKKSRCDDNKDVLKNELNTKEAKGNIETWAISTYRWIITGSLFGNKRFMPDEMI